VLFSRNPSPLQSSKFSFEYLLLPPRSAPEVVSRMVTHKRFSTASAPSYSSELRIYSEGWVSVAHLSALHFQSSPIRQMSCYTLLSGFRLPWPPSCCQDGVTSFVVSDECAFRHLNPTFGSTRIASSAYQKWPTSNFPFEELVQS